MYSLFLLFCILWVCINIVWYLSCHLYKRQICCCRKICYILKLLPIIFNKLHAVIFISLFHYISNILSFLPIQSPWTFLYHIILKTFLHFFCKQNQNFKVNQMGWFVFLNSASLLKTKVNIKMKLYARICFVFLF
jgi:hypothetical protein